MERHLSPQERAEEFCKEWVNYKEPSFGKAVKSLTAQISEAEREAVENLKEIAIKEGGKAYDKGYDDGFLAAHAKHELSEACCDACFMTGFAKAREKAAKIVEENLFNALAVDNPAEQYLAKCILALEPDSR